MRCLVVHSKSATWEPHIRGRWLRPFSGMTVALNLSERSTWRRTLAVRVFNRFCERDGNFSPAVVVFRGSRRPLVFRSYAFKEAKAGRPQYLEKLEADMLAALKIDRPRR